MLAAGYANWLLWFLWLAAAGQAPATASAQTKHGVGNFAIDPGGCSGPPQGPPASFLQHFLQPFLATLSCSRSADDVFEILKQNFDESYNGNRAPLPLFIHTPW